MPLTAVFIIRLFCTERPTGAAPTFPLRTAMGAGAGAEAPLLSSGLPGEEDL